MATALVSATMRARIFGKRGPGGRHHVSEVASAKAENE
jgi:hypothetical protein